MATWIMIVLTGFAPVAIDELVRWFRRDTRRFWRFVEAVTMPWIGAPYYMWKRESESAVAAATETLERFADSVESKNRVPYHRAAHDRTARSESRYASPLR